MAFNNNDLLNSINKFAGAQLAVLKDIKFLVGQVLGEVKAGGRPGGPGGPRRPRQISALAQFSKGLSQTLAALGIATAVVSGVIAAFAAVPLAIAGVVKASEKFVRALNPYLVEQYEREQQNLMATIGYALTPVIKYATKSLREWAGILLPSIQALQPVVESLSAAVSGALLGAVRILARWIDGFLKIFAPVTRQVESILESVGTLLEVIAAVYDVFVTLAGELKELVSFATTFASSLRYLTVAAGALVAQFLALIGATNGLRVYRESLEQALADRKKPQNGLLAAPKDAGIGSIEDIARKMSERAFAATASSGDTKKNETDLLTDILNRVIEIEKQPIKDLRATIAEGVRDGMLAIGTAPGKAILETTHPITDAGSNLWGSVKDTLRQGRAYFNRQTHSVLGGN